MVYGNKYRICILLQVPRAHICACLVQILVILPVLSMLYNVMYLLDILNATIPKLLLLYRNSTFKFFSKYKCFALGLHYGTADGSEFNFSEVPFS